MGVTGLSDREVEGDGEFDILDTLDAIEGGRADMLLGGDIFLGVEKFDGGETSSGVKTICDSDGMVLRIGIDLSDRGRGRRTVDQKGLLSGVVLVDDEALGESWSSEPLNEAMGDTRLVSVVALDVERVRRIGGCFAHPAKAREYRAGSAERWRPFTGDLGRRYIHSDRGESLSRAVPRGGVEQMEAARFDELGESGMGVEGVLTFPLRNRSESGRGKEKHSPAYTGSDV